ncbi:hypothetical protein ACFT9I_06700 [Streptomyces sp. NPDC057137]|uniref:hypothetical protein n=1 Tax=Streptomyces sp. NPDC057137 TaxID=3346030 RepID=UPI00363880E1
MSDRTTTAISPVEEVTAPADASTAPGTDPGTDAGTAPAPEPAPRRRTAALFAALRWTAAVAVFGVLGTAVAYVVTDRDRTDVPTLATKSDGRWTYPPLAKPTLPAGAVGPSGRGNSGQIHYADLAQLLLPAPEGSRPDPALGDKNSRVPVSRFLQEYDKSSRGAMAADLRDNGLRHIAARGWTMADDGTSTRVYLLRFNSAASTLFFFGSHLQGATDAPQKVTDVEKLSTADETFPAKAVHGTETYLYNEVAPRGPVHVRHAYISAGDTLALVIQSRKGSAPAVPFNQTVILQDQLLG